MSPRRRPYTPDAAMKQLSALAGLGVLQLIVPGATILEVRSTELPRNPLRPDSIYVLRLANGRRCMVDVEFVTKWEKRTAGQFLSYAGALLQNEPEDTAYRSYALCLFSDKDIPEPPLVVDDGEGAMTIGLWYRPVKLWEYSVDDVTDERLLAIAPLMQGATHKVLVDIRRRLEVLAAQAPASAPTGTPPLGQPVLTQADWLTLTIVFDFLVSLVDAQWTGVVGENRMLIDALKETPLYRQLHDYVVDEARKEGEEKGLEKGREEGRMSGQREVVLAFVRATFPNLVPQARWRVETLTSEQEIDALLIALARVQQDEAKASDLLATGEQ